MDYLDQIKNGQFKLKKIDTPHRNQLSDQQLAKISGNTNNPGEYLSQILQAVAERRSAMAAESDSESESEYSSDSSQWDD